MQRTFLKKGNVKRAGYLLLVMVLVMISFLWWPLKKDKIYALSAGPDYASTAVDGANGNTAWNSPSHATGAPDSNYATANGITLPCSAITSNYLVLTGFGFSIPAGSTIQGIQAQFDRYDGAVGGGGVVDNSILAIKGGSSVGTDQSTGAAWATSIEWDSFGGTSNLWGASWTPSDINSSNFGVEISAKTTKVGSACGAADIDSVEMTISYSAANSPPSTPSLSAPSSGATSVSITPQFQLSTTDPDSDYIQYRIYLYQSNCSTAVGSSPFAEAGSQTGWSGQNADSNLAYSSGSTATYTYQGALAYSTTYCWKADAIDPGGSDTYSSASATQLFTTLANSPPAAPTLSAPAGSATNISVLPDLQFKSTDANNDYLEYEVVIYQSDCSTLVRDVNETSSQTGWSGQDQQSGTAYTGSSALSSSTTATYSYQLPALSVNTTYCWKARAIDPGGSNTWSSYSSTSSFTTQSGTNVIIGGGTVINGGSSIQ